MDRHMLRRIAIWIDHREAIVITLNGAQVTDEEEIFSEVGPHTHGGGWSQHRIEAHRHEVLKHYYEEVVGHLGPVDKILILGPGQAKHELHHTIDHHKGLKGKVVAIDSAPRLTEQEVIGEAEQFFDAKSQESRS